jgi:hypothetical protein
MARKKIAKEQRAGHAALFVSIVALGVSGLTAYFNILRQVDDLRLLFSENPAIILDWKKNTAEISFFEPMTFINAGNRPATITTSTIVFLIVSVDNIEAPMPCRQKSWSMAFILDPEVIKPFVIEANKVLLFPFEYSFVYNLRSQKFIEEAKSFYLVACMNIEILTPDDLYNVEVSLLKRLVERGVDVIDPFEDKERSVRVLLRKNGWATF